MRSFKRLINSESQATEHHNTHSITSRCSVQLFEFLSDRRKLSTHIDWKYDSRLILKYFKRICEFREFLHSKSQSSFDSWVLWSYYLHQEELYCFLKFFVQSFCSQTHCTKDVYWETASSRHDMIFHLFNWDAHALYI